MMWVERRLSQSCCLSGKCNSQPSLGHATSMPSRRPRSGGGGMHDDGAPPPAQTNTPLADNNGSVVSNQTTGRGHRATGPSHQHFLSRLIRTFSVVRCPQSAQLTAAPAGPCARASPKQADEERGRHQRQRGCPQHFTPSAIARRLVARRRSPVWCNGSVRGQ